MLQHHFYSPTKMTTLHFYSMGHQKNSQVQTLNQCVTIDAVVLNSLQQDIMGSKMFPGLLDQIPTQPLTVSLF